MAKKCAICIHEKRCEIERDILQGVQYATISKKFSIKEACVRDHQSRSHMCKDLKKKRGEDMAALLEECLEISLGAAQEARTAKAYGAVGSIMSGPYKMLERATGPIEETGLDVIRKELKERRNVALTPG